MARQRYTVVFEQGDRPNQWTAFVKELPQCHTFGRGLAQTRARIREALVLWAGERAGRADLREVLPLPLAARTVIEQLGELNSRWEALMKRRQGIVAVLQRASWSLRDIAAVLGLSHQRVNQVSRRTRRRRRRVGAATG